MRISEAATGVGEEMADVGLAMQRALDKTENMQRPRRRGRRSSRRRARSRTSRSSAPARTTSTASSSELSSASQVDDELAKMKAELGRAARRRRAGGGTAARAGAQA